MTDDFDIHGVHLRVSSDDAEVQQQIGRRLRWLRGASDGGRPDIDIRIRADRDAPELVAPAQRRRVYDPPEGEVSVCVETGRLWMQSGGVSVLLDPVAGHVDVRVVEPTAQQRWLVSHGFFTVILVEALKHRARYPVHASSCERDGRAVLFAGSSGSGKTTLCLALLRAGFGYLGDDTVFIDASGAEPIALAFPDEIDITSTTAALFPELSELVSQEPPCGASKLPVLAEDLYGTKPTRRAQPVALVFPRIASGKSALTPCSTSDALRELVANVLLTEQTATQAHLDVLGRLARDLPAFRLETGQDLDRLPALMQPLIARLTSPREG